MTAPLLEVQNLRVAFGGKEVVHGIDFTVGAGEKLALVGESGSGKTVTALSLLRLVQNAELSGVVNFSGRISPQSPSAVRNTLSISERELRGIRGKEIAMIFQEPMTALNALYSVGDQIAEVLELHEGLSKRDAFAAAVQLLAYEWRLALGGFAADGVNGAPAPSAELPALADAASVQGALEHWQRALVALDYLDPQAPKKLMPRLQQLLNRAQLREEEIHILRGIAKKILQNQGA